MAPITTRRDGDVLIVTSDNPPVNALGFAVRDGRMRAIAHVAPDVRAIVIACAGRTFFAGADIAEFGQAPRWVAGFRAKCDQL